MFAPKVPKPQAKDQHRSHNESAIGRMPPRSISGTYWRPLSPERSLWPSGNATRAQSDETPAIKTTSTAAWNFCQVPVSLPERMGGLVPPFPAPAPCLPIQAKLKVGAVNDPLEHETDRVADQVLRMPAPEAALTSAPQKISRKCAACEEENKEQLQMKAAGAATPAREAPPFVHEVLRERKSGVVHGPAGTANTFDACPAQWKPKANAAQKLASSWLANVVIGLASLPKPIPAPVANLLTKHFHTTFDKDIAKIAGRYAQLNTAINQSIDFECETSCDPDVLAYVYSIWSDVHLCPYWFNSRKGQQAHTVIHELAHDVVGCDDNAYEWQTAKYNGMSVDDAIDNADSYAYFAWDAYTGSARGP